MTEYGKIYHNSVMHEPLTQKVPLRRILLVFLVVISLIALETGQYWYFYDDSLEKIKRRGKLIVLSENNANAYYLYREAPMGFEYELAKAFADYLGVGIEVRIPGWNNLFESLLAGEGDLIAAGIAITPERQALCAFSDSYMPVQQQVILNKSNNLIKTIDDLAGYTIHVRQGTAYEKRLRKLQRQGLKLTILSHLDITTEELIQLVAARQIPVTIANSNIALLNRRYYPDIKIAFPIGEELRLAWAVRKIDINLLAEINRFLETIKKNGTLGKIYNRYYATVNEFDYVDLKKFHRRLKTRLPEFKDIIEQEAEKYGFDWRLIAAVIYQESHFNPFATSHTGVKGIMQLTELTAAELGVEDRFDPSESIRGGVQYLAKMRGRFSHIKDPLTRLQFMLASYNIGYGHVRDAQQLARQLGLDETSWQDLKTVLPLLRNKKYYAQTDYGYARGNEAVRYVQRVMLYYDILKNRALELKRI